MISLLGCCKVLHVFKHRGNIKRDGWGLQISNGRLLRSIINDNNVDNSFTIM